MKSFKPPLINYTNTLENVRTTYIELISFFLFFIYFPEISHIFNKYCNQIKCLGFFMARPIKTTFGGIKTNKKLCLFFIAQKKKKIKILVKNFVKFYEVSSHWAYPETNLVQGIMIVSLGIPFFLFLIFFFWPQTWGCRQLFHMNRVKSWNWVLLMQKHTHTSIYVYAHAHTRTHAGR